jgi:hypothetical protein
MNSSMTTSGSSASLSPASSSERSANPSTQGGSREDDLRRALRHHARALKALRGSAYETLSEPTRRQLITKLEHDWSELKDRLRELNASRPDSHTDTADGSSDATAESVSSTPRDNDRWMRQLTTRFRS